MAGIGIFDGPGEALPLQLGTPMSQTPIHFKREGDQGALTATLHIKPFSCCSNDLCRPRKLAQSALPALFLSVFVNAPWIGT